MWIFEVYCTSDDSLEDVLEKRKDFCEKSWDFTKTSVAPQPFIEQYCFRAPYVVSLLNEGLHITDSHAILGSGSVIWTLGAALLEVRKVVSKSSLCSFSDRIEEEVVEDAAAAEEDDFQFAREIPGMCHLEKYIRQFSITGGGGQQWWERM